MLFLYQLNLQFLFLIFFHLRQLFQFFYLLLIFFSLELIQFELDQFSENVQKDLAISERSSFYQEISNLLRDSNWWSTATVTDACKYYLKCARNNISYFENYVEADSDLSQNQKNEIFALYQLCTLFVSWNAIKDKKIREIIDIRKSLFFR